MSVIGSNILAGASGQGGGYNLTRSLRLRNSATAYLKNQNQSSGGDSLKYTISCWVKRGSLSNVQTITSAFTNPDNNGSMALFFETTGQLGFGSYYAPWRLTTAVFRDPSAWYHIVAVWDSANATASNRVRLYVNNVEQTSFATNNTPTQNYGNPYCANDDGSGWGGQNIIGATRAIGALAWYQLLTFDGYITEFNCVQGQALTPSSFGENNAQTGVWQPKRYAGTYGTNGFYLPFTDNSALTSGSNAGLGKDFSGNGNYWNTNNISITSGSTYDSMTDVPTLTDASTANYCVINPLDNYYMGGTISNGNLQILTGYSSNNYITGTQGVSSGKWYYEATLSAITGNTWCGVGWASKQSTSSSDNTGSITYVGADGTVGGASGGPTYTAGDTIGVMIDLDNNLVYFSKNGTLINSGNGYSITAASATTTGFYYPALADYDGTGTKTWVANFGQRPFAYTPPTGFVALNTYNLPTPTIGATASTLANKYFDATTYTGDGTSSRNITGLNFQPDFVWNKVRSISTSHALTDSVRQAPNQLSTNSTGAEVTDYYYGGVSAFLSNGFTAVAGGGGAARVNASGETYVAWAWKANGTGVTNTAGSITSTVSANTSAGFSVVTYTGNSTQPSTVGHGLGVAPKMIIVKSRSSGGTYYDWAVYNSNIGAANALLLNSTSGSFAKNSYWVSTAPTSSVFTLGSDITVNQSGVTYVAYCFAEVAGYSKFGSYTGNGSSDGTFVYTGFRPRYIMVKRTDAIANWTVYDTSRSPSNQVELHLRPNTSQADDTGTSEAIDILSNGFKARGTSTQINVSGANYIYYAVAETPAKFSLAR